MEQYNNPERKMYSTALYNYYRYSLPRSQVKKYKITKEEFEDKIVEARKNVINYREYEQALLEFICKNPFLGEKVFEVVVNLTEE
jgi:hypothetical protein